MTASRRLAKELLDLRETPNEGFHKITVDEKNMLSWSLLLVPQQYPFNKGAFKIELHFPPEYPFKPPKLNFQTKIYHPNVDEKGQICLPIISAENWKPATKTKQDALLDLIQTPEPEHPLRANLAEQYSKDKGKFMKAAEEFTIKNAEKRPTG